jgi:hypothetical protein
MNGKRRFPTCNRLRRRAERPSLLLLYPRHPLTAFRPDPGKPFSYGALVGRAKKPLLGYHCLLFELRDDMKGP